MYQTDLHKRFASFSNNLHALNFSFNHLLGIMLHFIISEKISNKSETEHCTITMLETNIQNLTGCNL